MVNQDKDPNRPYAMTVRDKDGNEVKVNWNNDVNAPKNEIKDTEWLCNCFLLPKEALGALNRKRQYYTTADRKFGDNAPGGGKVLNQPPGFTRYADIPTGFGGAEGFVAKGPKRMSDGGYVETNLGGYGPCYSESIDDNLDVIHIRPGVAEYNSLTAFYLNMYDITTGELARTGEGDGVIGTLAKVAGLLVAAPIVTFITVGRFLRWALNGGRTYSAYYYLKPTDALYWKIVNTTVNQFAVKAGFVPGVEPKGWKDGGPVTGKGLSKSEVSAFNKWLPSVYRFVGGEYVGFDVMAISSRYKRLEIAYRKELSALTDYNINKININKLKENTTSGGSYKNCVEMLHGYDTAIKDIKKPAGGNDNTIIDIKQGKRGINTLSQDNDSFWSHLKANLDSGTAFASFAVDYIGETTTSVNNSTGESSTASTINGIISSSKNMQQGIGKRILDSVGISGIASSIADGMQLDFLSALAGNGFVDIPNIWQDSTAELPKHQYKIELTSASAHPMSKLQNIYMPLFALMALAYPLATGAQSYTSPFLLELYHKGKNKISLGMISDMNIQLGDGDPGSFDIQEFPNHATITFSIVNLSNKLAIPPDANTSGFMNEDNNYTDMLNIMSAMGVYDQTSYLQSLKRTKQQWIQDIGQWRSPAHVANVLGSGIRGSFINLALQPANLD